MLWCKDYPSTLLHIAQKSSVSFLIWLEMPSAADLLLLTRCLQNEDIIGDGKNIHSFSIYYESVKSNFWYLKIEELTEWEIFGEWGERRSDFAIWGLGRHERKSILGVLCRCWESLKSRIRSLETWEEDKGMSGEGSWREEGMRDAKMDGNESWEGIKDEFHLEILPRIDHKYSSIYVIS